MVQLKEWDNLAIKDLLATVKNQQNDTGRLHLCWNTKNATLPSLTNTDTYTGMHKDLKQATPSCQTGMSPRKGTWRGTTKATSVLSATFSLKCKAHLFFPFYFFYFWPFTVVNLCFCKRFYLFEKEQEKTQVAAGGRGEKQIPSEWGAQCEIFPRTLRLWPELKADA